jgi:hypothetical protein
VTAIYVTVNRYDKKTPVAARPLCEGCTPSSVDGRSELLVPPERAEYQVVGASGTIALCRNCAIHSIKSLAARFMMFDPSATRDLMSFFAAEAAKKRPTMKKRPMTKKKRPKSVIDVVVPHLLEGKKSP